MENKSGGGGNSNSSAGSSNSNSTTTTTSAVTPASTSNTAATASSASPVPGIGILPRPADPNQWGWVARRGAMRAGFFPHGPRPPGLPYMRPGFFHRHPRVYPMHPHHFPHRKPVPGAGPGPPGWSGLPTPPPTPRIMPPPYLPVPVVPGAAATGADPYHMVQPPAWPTPPPTPTSTTDDDPSSMGEKKKKKRVANGNARPWNREAAEKALQVEMEYQNAGANAVVVRFPDPDLSKEIVQGFHSSIENVHFQSPCGPRYCFVMVDKDADVDKVIEDLNKIKFGMGHLKAERKVPKNYEPVTPESIDPFSLYVGNLPTNISTVEVKEKFPTATRIDIGYAQKLKYTRYAFIRYGSADDALDAFKASVNTVIASRSIILRFRRHKGPVGPKGEKPCPPEIEAKPGEKLTVGAKLKAKREKLKAEKEKEEKNSKPKKKKIKLEKEESSSDDEVELENVEDDDSPEEDVEEDDDDDDSDDDDEEEEDEDDDDDDDDMDEVGNDDDDDDDEELDDDGPDDDDMYDDGPDDEEYLYKNAFGSSTSDWNGSFDF